MTEIIYPTLDLFLYDRRSRLGDSKEEEIEKSRESFRQKLPEGIRTEVFQQDSMFDVEYTVLFNPRDAIFHANRDSKPLEGYYYPVRLVDSYGLLLDCSIDDKTEPQSATSFTILKQEIEAKLNNQQPTLGQTWLISAIVPNLDNLEQQDSLEIAKSCYQALMPKGNWKLESWKRELGGEKQGEGDFLGGKIFETYSYDLLMKEGAEQLDNIHEIQDSEHVVIILYPDLAAARKAARFYGDWVQLFYYRHKVLWGYGTSRLLKSCLSNRLSKIKKTIKLLREKDKKSLNFDNIKKTLGKLQDYVVPYTLDLSLLKFQHDNIKNNSADYDKTLKKINKKVGEESNLELFKEFSEEISDKYLKEIEQDKQEFEGNSSLLDTAIKTLEDQVEIKKAQNQQLFQNLVYFWTSGVTVYGTVTSWLHKLFVLDPAKEVAFSVIITVITMVIFIRVYVWWKQRS